jgi:hypothetical protein
MKEINRYRQLALTSDELSPFRWAPNLAKRADRPSWPFPYRIIIAKQPYLAHSMSAN